MANDRRSTNTASLFSLQDVTFTVAGKTVVHISDLSFAEDKIHAVIGPNGAGKTTLLRLLNLLLEPSSGTLLYRGRDVSLLSGAEKVSIRRQMCMVMQNVYLFEATVFDNVAYPLRLRGIPGPEVTRRAFEALDFVGLADLSQRNARTLSGGEAQRAALARAVAVRPRVLLLDEPTANLDPGSVAAIEALITELHHTLNTTVIMVTHNLFQARRLADEVLFLLQGEAVEKAPVQQLFTNPASELTRQFVSGTMVY